MLHVLWGGMILVGILYGLFTGNAELLGNRALESAKEAVNLAIAMAGAMAFWSGLMEVAKVSGLLDTLVRALRRPVRLLFPGVPEGHPAEEAIATNLVANILGLGWAATPAGIRAMRELKILQKEQEGEDTNTASDDMCSFLIINVSSLQLIPVNIIAYRGQYGSTSPEAILGFSLITTVCSTVVAIIYVILRRKLRKTKAFLIKKN